jgi:hypothetical protein
MTRYRWRDVFLLCTGVSLAGSYLFWSVLDSGWLVWLAPLAGGSLAGVLLGDWYSGSGAGGYSAALAGFLFVTGNFLPMGLGGAASRGLFALTLFAVVGVTAGAATGYATGWYRGRGADGDGGQASADGDGRLADSDTDGGQTAPDGDAPSGE